MPNVYVIRARKAGTVYQPTEQNWFFAIPFDGASSVCYTTDMQEAKRFDSLLSADSYAAALDMESPEYSHAVDLYKP